MYTPDEVFEAIARNIDMFMRVTLCSKFTYRYTTGKVVTFTRDTNGKISKVEAV
jgi:hypothetical protein